MSAKKTTSLAGKLTRQQPPTQAITPAAKPAAEAEKKVQFNSTIYPSTLLVVDRVCHWERMTKSEYVDAALLEYGKKFASHTEPTPKE